MIFSMVSHRDPAASDQITGRNWQQYCGSGDMKLLTDDSAKSTSA
jgi:hypothetical protein